MVTDHRLRDSIPQIIGVDEPGRRGARQLLVAGNDRLPHSIPRPGLAIPSFQSLLSWIVLLGKIWIVNRLSGSVNHQPPQQFGIKPTSTIAGSPCFFGFIHFVRKKVCNQTQS